MRRPKPSLTTFYSRYAVALATPLLGWAVRQAFTPVWGPTAVPFIFSYPAVAVACWSGRMLPGIVAIAASIALATWAFIEPLDSLALSRGAALQLVSFAAMSMVIVAAIEAMHRAKAWPSSRGVNCPSSWKASANVSICSMPTAGLPTSMPKWSVTSAARAAQCSAGWHGKSFPKSSAANSTGVFRVAMAEGRPRAVPGPVSGEPPLAGNPGLSIERGAFGFLPGRHGTPGSGGGAAEGQRCTGCSQPAIEEKVLERTAKLRESVADLEQFSYSISHDFRSPLRSMQAFSALLLEEYQEKLAPTAVNYLLRLDSSAKRMLKLLEAVLSYTGVARSEIDLTRVDLDQLIREILEQYPNLLPDSVDIEIVEPLLPVRGSVARLTQCLSNVLGNAVKFVASRARGPACASGPKSVTDGFGCVSGTMGSGLTLG